MIPREYQHAARLAAMWLCILMGAWYGSRAFADTPTLLALYNAALAAFFMAAAAVLKD